MSKFHKPFSRFSTEMYPKGSCTQKFGENPELYSLWGLRAHNGADYVAPHGTPILNIEEGTVVIVKDSPEGYGKYVRVLSETSDGKYREWTYGHLSAIHVTEGQTLKEGETLGLMGNTGFVISGATPYWKHNPYAGTHLHLGLRYAKETKNGWRHNLNSPKIEIANYNNGYKGCVNPAPLLSGETDLKPMMLTVISLANEVIRLLKLKQSK